MNTGPGRAKELQAGQIARLQCCENGEVSYDGCSSSEVFAKQDSVADVTRGAADVILIVKVLAVVRRSAVVVE